MGLITSSLPECGGGDTSEGLPPWASGPSSVYQAGDRLPFVVQRRSLEWGSRQTFRFWKLSVTAPGAGCQVILLLSVEKNRYGKGTADYLSQNQIPSHPTIPRSFRLPRGAVPWMGPSQVSRNWTWVWLSCMVGSSGLPELAEKRDGCQDISGWALSLPDTASPPSSIFGMKRGSASATHVLAD